jgi:predicted aspartyl protease
MMKNPGDAFMGRFSANCIVANNRDVLISGVDAILSDEACHAKISGIVDSGAARLVIPQSLVDKLSLIPDGETVVKYAGQRRERRAVVSNVWLQAEGRHGVFSAVVEPARTDLLIGAIVLEELDLIVDCGQQKLIPRDPQHVVTEIE